MRIVSLDGRTWTDDAPSRDVLDARVGSGLIETMRAIGGRIAFRTLHMDRLRTSITACGMSDAAPPVVIDAALDAVVGTAGAGDLRVRLVVGRSGSVLVEADGVESLASDPLSITAVVEVGLWDPQDPTAEHKLTDRDRWRAAELRAAAAGADVVVAADRLGRLGEASRASVFVVRSAEVRTAPVEGILPGIGRRAILAAAGAVSEAAPGPDVWRTADEIVAVSALRGVSSIVSVDGVQVGDGSPGPVARRWAAAFVERAVALRS